MPGKIPFWSFHIFVAAALLLHVPFTGFAQINDSNLEVEQVRCPDNADTPLALDDVYYIEKEEEVVLCPAMNDYLPGGTTFSLRVIEIVHHSIDDEEEDDDEEDDHDEDDNDEEDDAHNNGSLKDGEDEKKTYRPTSVEQQGNCLTVMASNKKNWKTYVRYQICQQGKCDEALVLIQAIDVKKKKVKTANEQVYTLLNQSVSYDVMLNDRPLDEETYLAIKKVYHGTAEVNGSEIIFTPEPGYTGLARVKYKVCSGSGKKDYCKYGYLYIHVCGTIPTPIAKNDRYTLDQGDQLTVQAPGVLENDLLDGAASGTASLLQSVAHGRLQLAIDGSFNYEPDPAFAGEDRFQYKLTTEYGTSDIAEVSIQVRASSAIKTSPDNYTLNEGAILTVPASNGVMANDELDTEGDVIARMIKPATQGTVILNADGSFRYSHNGNEVRQDQFTYSLVRGEWSSAPETVSLIINNINDAPVAVGDEYELSPNSTELTITADRGVLQNDRDPERSPITAHLVDQPEMGYVVLQPNGAFVYTSPSPVRTTQVFHYRASDGEAVSEPVQVVIAPDPTQPMVANNDTYQLTAGSALTTTAADGLLANDDFGDNLPSIIITRPPAYGTIEVQNNGSFTYITNSGIAGTEIITYKLVNGTRRSNDAIVTFTILPSNRPPVVTGEGPFTVQAGQSYSVNLLQNDYDPEGETLYLTSLEMDSPGTGVSSWNDRGEMTFTAHYLYSGRVSAVYTVSDGQLEASGRVIFDVTPPETMSISVRSGDPVNLCQQLSAASRSTITVPRIFQEPGMGLLGAEPTCPIYYPENPENEIITENILISVCEGVTTCRTLNLAVNIIPALQIYDGFSPNGDYSNETWHITGIEWYLTNHLRVYNQSGEMVFEAADYNNKDVVWTGTGNTGSYREKVLSEGIYYYILDLGEGEQKKGHVVLAR